MGQSLFKTRFSFAFVLNADNANAISWILFRIPWLWHTSKTHEIFVHFKNFLLHACLVQTPVARYARIYIRS